MLKSLENELDVIPELNEQLINELQEKGAINTGMMPKTDNALRASKGGVGEVVIGNLLLIQKGESPGTRIV